MTNTAGITIQMKKDMLTAGQDIDSDTIKAALYLASASIDDTVATYTSTGEVSGTNYTAGGVAITNGTTASSGSTVYWTPGASITYSNVTLASSFDCVLLYNTSKTNKTICAVTFTAQTVSAADFVINMPTNDATHALIQLN